MKNPINQISLEGPDLSGKTTLYYELHEKTRYRWNIQDRSCLSMLVFAKLYGRAEFHHVERLKNELSNLNNFVIILLPDWNVISKRFTSRGDEIQSFVSLRKVYNLFEEAANELENLPNVCVIKNEIDDFIITSLVKNLVAFENMNYSDASNSFMNACLSCESFERIGVSLTSYDYGDFSDVKDEYLNHEKEKVYYSEIKEKVLRKIDDELNGINEYSRVESLNSRRFIYTSDTCISLAHFLVRDGMLDCKFFVRSSDTKDTLKYDLNFIKYLCRCVKNHLNLPENDIAKIHLLVNSVHIPSNIDF